MPTTKQLFVEDKHLQTSVQALASSDIGGRGAIFTRQEVVNFILDLVGYETKYNLTTFRFLEPSFGEGDFLESVVVRLIRSARNHGVALSVESVGDSIRAVELHGASYRLTRKKLSKLLTQEGVHPKTVNKILDKWLIQGDFLLTEFDIESFTHTVGNPPYIRQEDVPTNLMEEYRSRYMTIYDRADIYVPFYERSLGLLSDGGKLGFICANRWMKNRYGVKLRAYIASNFNLDFYVDMVGTKAFTSEVIAYPAITVISKTNERIPTKVSSRPTIEAEHLSKLATNLKEGVGEMVSYSIEGSGTPWFLDTSASNILIKRIESDFPTLEEVGCKIGIGVASGADKVFIGDYDELDVEDSRKVPLVKTVDIRSGEVEWQGKGILNPFNDDGSLVNLEDYPRLYKYMMQHENVLKNRHVAKKIPNKWYRTIDKIHTSLTSIPKLLIPDIKGTAHVVYESGTYYPHHNLYYITSELWDLKLLKAILESGIAHLFINTYSTKMHGDCLRFQAQYLRRIRVPKLESVSPQVLRSLKSAVQKNDKNKIQNIVSDMYCLTNSERDMLNQYGLKTK